MIFNKVKRQKLSYLLVKSTLYSALGLFSLVLLSESVGARGMLPQLQIAQQPATNQSDATRAEAEKLMQEALQLFRQETAQKQLWQSYQWSSPHYWAAFTLQREWR